MTCQEVMDYMQRQLDGDLDDRETEILMTHTRHCPDCNRMFERLQLLSSGLENLPKVTPSYSLVDAILPRLAELQAAGPAAENEALQLERPAERLTARAERSGNTSRRRNGRISFGVLGGVIAAGIAVGLFLVNYHSGDPLRSGSAEQATASSDSAAVADSGKVSSSGSSAANKPLMQDLKRDTNAADEKQKVGASSDASGGSAGGAPAASSPRADSGNAFHYGPQTDAAASNEPANPDAKSGDSYSGAKQQPPNYTESGSGFQMGISAAEPDSSAKDHNAADAPKSSGTNQEKSPMLAAPATSEWGSPDGRYKAAFADSRLRIFVVADGTMLFESQKRPSGISAVKWAADGKTLTYETKADDGSAVVYKVDPVNGTEQPQGK